MSNCHCCSSSSAHPLNLYYRGEQISPSTMACLCEQCLNVALDVIHRSKGMPTLDEIKIEYAKSKTKAIISSSSSSSSSSASTTSVTSIAARSMEQKVTTTASLSNWTIVRVWLPRRANGEFCVAHSAENVGHASLETSGIHASFWPEWQVKTVKKVAVASKVNAKLGTFVGKFEAVLGTAKGINHDTPQIDLELEGHPPEVVVILSSLNTTKINQYFNNFLKSSESKKWSLCGSNVFNVFNGGSGQSCSGLVYDLLKAGGLFENLDYPSDWTTNFTIAPDGIAKMVIRASEYEKEYSFQKHTTVKSKFGTVQMMIPRCELNFHNWSIGWWLSGGSFEPKYPTYTPVQPKKS